MRLVASGSQTVGPYLHIGLTWLNTDRIAGPGVKGERVVIQGRLVDGDGVGVSDGLVEIWQANAAGKYPHPEDRQKKALEKGFRGFGRIPTDAKGHFRFSTVKPGRVPGPAGKLQAPHLSVSVFMRGLLKQLSTRIYFPPSSRPSRQQSRSPCTSSRTPGGSSSDRALATACADHRADCRLRKPPHHAARKRG